MPKQCGFLYSQVFLESIPRKYQETNVFKSYKRRVRVQVGRVERRKSVLFIIWSLEASSLTDWVLDFPNSLIWRIIIHKLFLEGEFHPLEFLFNGNIFYSKKKKKNYTWLGVWERTWKPLIPGVLVNTFNPHLPLLRIESLVPIISTQH